MAPSESSLLRIETQKLVGSSPARDRALEDAHAELRLVGLWLEREEEPTFDPIPIARAIELSLECVFDALDLRRDALEAIQGAIHSIDDARQLIGTTNHADVELARLRLSKAVSALERALSTLGAPIPFRPPAAPPLLASMQEPRLHALLRPTFVPPLEVKPLKPTHAAVLDEPIAKPTTFAELKRAVALLKTRAQASQKRHAAALAQDADEQEENEPESERIEPVAGFSLHVDPAMDEATFLRDRARLSFEEIAMLSVQRKPTAGEPFRHALVFERRMLAAIDLIAALGPEAIAYVPRLVSDAPIKDPTRVFAAGLILGCIAGRDALAAAERSLFSVRGLDRACVEELGSALALVPHDRLSLALQTLLGSEEPLFRAMAIEVLGRRRLATVEQLDAAALDEPIVAHHAMLRLALQLGLLRDAHLERALSSSDALLQDAAFVSLALVGDPRRLARVMEERGELSQRSLWLALAGDEYDAKTLADRSEIAPSPPLAEALGWAGHAASIPTLMTLLERKEEDIRVAAAWALDRITNAGLWEFVEVEAEDLSAERPPRSAIEKPRTPRLAKLLADPRDEPPKPGRERVDRPSTDPARWQAFWRERASSFDMRGRYRLGQPYSPLVVLRELDVARRSPEERRLLQLELVIRTGSFVPFDPRDFVETQERSIAAWQPHARAASSAPGRFVRPERRLA